MGSCNVKERCVVNIVFSSPKLQDAPKKASSRDSDSEEDEQNSEGSTDSDEELDSPRRIYQVNNMKM